MIRYVNLKDLRPKLPKVMEAVHCRLDRYVVTKRGKPVAVVISPDDYEGMLETLDILEDKAGLQRLRRAKREAKDGRTRSLADIRRDLGRA
ncbi:MAG: type II toxin-antitoxin system Phd/YefM family antitoxin [Elusimicrobiota bacterium]|jgi:prevent-host-death family protein